MAAWAHGGSYGDRVRFLMLCVETGASGLRTAKAFGKEFRLPATVVNGYIESKSELPRFGQLGCGGFVVLGRHGEFVAARTVPISTEAATAPELRPSRHRIRRVR